MLHQSTLKFFFPAYQTKALQKEGKIEGTEEGRNILNVLAKHDYL